MCEGVGCLRDPLDREGIWEEEGAELERGVWGDGMEDLVVEEEDAEEGLVGLVVSAFGADWELLLAELG